MDRWPQLVIGQRYVINAAHGGVVAKPRGALAELEDGWARILHEEPRSGRTGRAPDIHSCWVPLDRVLTITELETSVEPVSGGPDRATTAERGTDDHSRWIRPRPTLDELTVSVLGA